MTECLRSEWRPVPLRAVDKLCRAYLSALESSVPDTTYYSHQTALRQFSSWWGSISTEEYLEDDDLTNYVEYLLSGASLSPHTIAGRLSSLSSFFSYCLEGSPGVVRFRIGLVLQRLSDSSRSEPGVVLDHLQTRAGPHTVRSVEALLTYLRHRKYGTRTHAYVEVTYDTAGQATSIRNLSNSDLDLAAQTISLEIPATHVVSAAGLVTSWTVHLSEDVASALETYLHQERPATSGNGDLPIFATASGRASESTLRRSVKQASESARECIHHFPEATPTEQLSGNELEIVTPSDLRQAALDRIRGRR